MSSHSDSEIKTAKEKRWRIKNNGVAKQRRPPLTIQHILSTSIKNEVPKSCIEYIQDKLLIRAASFNNYEEAVRLLNAGVSASCCDSQLRSPLHLAASKGYVEMAQLLLTRGADPNQRDLIKNTPLHLAACTSNLKIIKLLIDNGAEIDAADLHGRNPLQLASSKLEILQNSWKEGAIELINLRRQLQEIVEVMISLSKRRTIPHISSVDDLQMMKLSISSGPDENVNDQMDKIALELAQFSVE